MLHNKGKQGKWLPYELIYEERGAGCRRRFTPSGRKCSGGADPIRWTTAEIYNDILKKRINYFYWDSHSNLLITADIINKINIKLFNRVNAD